MGEDCRRLGKIVQREDKGIQIQLLLSDLVSNRPVLHSEKEEIHVFVVHKAIGRWQGDRNTSK